MGAHFWEEHDRKQRAREAALERETEHLRADPAEHVRVWDAFSILANILGREKALAAWVR